MLNLSLWKSSVLLYSGAFAVRYLRCTFDPPDLVGIGLGIRENNPIPGGDRNHAAT
jgi:hypothetical protein